MLCASAAELANSPEDSVLSVAKAHGSILVICSGVTVSGKPKATRVAAGSVAIETTVLNGVTAIAREASVGISAIKARLGNSLFVRISLPPIDRILSS